MDHVFTTEVIEPNRKADFWRQFVCDHIADVDCHIRNSTGFRGEIRSFPLVQINMSLISAEPHEVYRREERIQRRKNDYFVILYQKSGIADYQQNNMTIRLNPGDFVLYDPRLPYHMILLEPFEHIAIRLPRYMLSILETDVATILGHLVPATSLGGELVTAFLRPLIEKIDEMEAVDLHAYVEAAVSIFIQSIRRELGHGVHSASENTVRTLARAKHFIIRNLDDFDLSLENVADDMGISVRHLGRLFQKEGLSPARWIKSLRLERSASYLVHPTHAGKSVSEIAFMVGFGDISHFCREFKQAYRHSPGQYRSLFKMN